jgi:tripartite-type tricarboxylate transporter receptor subunit TctC
MVVRQLLSRASDDARRNGAGAELSQQADPPDRAVAGGRRRRHFRAHRLAAFERASRPAHRDREQTGAGGNIGTAVAAQEKPDGYTLLQGSAAPHGINPHIYKSLGFEPIKDFTFIAHVYSAPSFLVVPTHSPFNTAQELVDYAKANPGKLNFGSSGIGGSHHVFVSLFMERAGFEAVHIPYKGTSPMETALVAGQIDFSLDPPTCLPFIQSGKMRVLGVASKQRNPAMPDVPTLDEQGITGVYSSTYYGILGPANMPKEIVDRLNKEVNAVLQTEEIRARLTRMGVESGKGTPEEFKAFAEEDLERYGVLIRRTGADKID